MCAALTRAHLHIQQLLLWMRKNPSTQKCPKISAWNTTCVLRHRSTDDTRLDTPDTQYAQRRVCMHTIADALTRERERDAVRHHMGAFATTRLSVTPSGTTWVRLRQPGWDSRQAKRCRGAFSWLLL